MGFFDKSANAPKSEKQTTPRVESKRDTTPSKSSFGGTLIGPKMVIEGITKGEEDIYVEGVVKGDLVCQKHLVVGEKGRVEAKVQCQSMTVKGSVRGNVEARDRITIEATGRLIGDITAKVFINEPGGFFEGYSHMLRDEKPTRANQPNQKKK